MNRTSTAVSPKPELEQTGRHAGPRSFYLGFWSWVLEFFRSGERQVFELEGYRVLHSDPGVADQLGGFAELVAAGVGEGQLALGIGGAGRLPVDAVDLVLVTLGVVQLEAL